MRMAILQQNLDNEFAALRSENEEREKAQMLEWEQKDDVLAKLMAARRNLLTSALMWVGVRPGGDPGADMRALNQRIRARMTELGMREQSIFRCAQCRDTGWLSQEPPVRCACYESALDARIRDDHDAVLGDGSFERFRPEFIPETPVSLGCTQRSLLCRYRDILKRYSDHFPNVEKKLLFLYGGSGLGKTFLLNAVTRRVRERRIDALYITAPRMLEILRAAMMRDDASLSEELFTTPLLLIDDLGMEPMMNKITVEQVYLLIDERMRANRPTIISSNLTIREIKERYNERIASRLGDEQAGSMLVFLGDDLRARRSK